MHALVRFIVICWLLISTSLGLLFALTPAEVVQARLRQTNAAAFSPPALPVVSAARYAGLRLGLLAAAVGSAGALVLLHRARPARRVARARWRAEWRRAWCSLLAAWRRLVPAQRLAALLLGAAALALRARAFSHHR